MVCVCVCVRACGRARARAREKAEVKTGCLRLLLSTLFLRQDRSLEPDLLATKPVIYLFPCSNALPSAGPSACSCSWASTGMGSEPRAAAYAANSFLTKRQSQL